MDYLSDSVTLSSIAFVNPNEEAFKCEGNNIKYLLTDGD